MEYLDLIGKIWEYNKENKLGSHSLLFYLFLIKEFNKTFSNGISEVEFEMSDKVIVQELNFGRPAIRRAKKNLREHGLLTFKRKNGFATKYKLILDFNKSNPVSLPNSAAIHNASINKKSQLSIAHEEESPKTAKEAKTRAINKEPSVTNKSKQLPTSISSKVAPPSWEEFHDFVTKIKGFTPEMEKWWKYKYDMWRNNGWRNGHGYQIFNWKKTAQNTASHYNIEQSQMKLEDIPTIKRSKTYNE